MSSISHPNTPLRKELTKGGRTLLSLVEQMEGDRRQSMKHIQSICHGMTRPSPEILLLAESVYGINRLCEMIESLYAIYGDIREAHLEEHTLGFHNQEAAKLFHEACERNGLKASLSSSEVTILCTQEEFERIEYDLLHASFNYGIPVELEPAYAHQGN